MEITIFIGVIVLAVAFVVWLCLYMTKDFKTDSQDNQDSNSDNFTLAMGMHKPTSVIAAITPEISKEKK